MSKEIKEQFVHQLLNIYQQSFFCNPITFLTVLQVASDSLLSQTSSHEFRHLMRDLVGSWAAYSPHSPTVSLTGGSFNILTEVDGTHSIHKNQIFKLLHELEPLRLDAILQCLRPIYPSEYAGGVRGDKGDIGNPGAGFPGAHPGMGRPMYGVPPVPRPDYIGDCKDVALQQKIQTMGMQIDQLQFRLAMMEFNNPRYSQPQPQPGGIDMTQSTQKN